MAPMLGRKPFPLAKPLTEPLLPGEEVYTIEHSKESFKSKEEYEARLEKYGQHIWTCKSTGSSQLTHKEAWDEEEEVSELLKEEFQGWYEKPVLEIVHHNTLSLDKLVDQAHLEIMTKYAVDEECDFEVGKEKYMRVKIVKVYPLEDADQETCEKKPEGACDSPSSDKENSNQVVLDNHIKEPLQLDEESGIRESLRDRLSDRARRSPRKLPTSLKKEEKKWVPPKFLPHKYDVKLVNEDKIISSVPVDSLYRSERPPNKEIIRYFIRHFALRIGTGENAPWVVEDELVKKFALPSKFSDFLLDPHKYMTLNSPTNSSAKKRKRSTSPEKKPVKKIKVKKDGDKNIKDKKRKKPPLTAPLSPTLWCHVHLNKSVIPSPLKINNRDGPMTLGGEMEDVMRVVSPSKLNSNFAVPKKCSLSGVVLGKKKVKKEKAKVLNGQKASMKPKSPKKVLKNPKMKQMTLLDMAKGSPKVSRPPKGSAVAPRTSSKPQKLVSPTALHLIAYYKDNKDREDRKASLSCLITKSVRLLSNEDLARLPEELRLLVQKRHDQLEHKKKWASMTEDQRKEYLQEKRNELKEKMREKAKERREKEMQEKLEKQRRYEDQELTGKSLPTFKLVDTPEGLPNTLFGDVAMVVEFLSCYSGLLMPDGQYPVTAVSMMEALTAEKGGFLYLNRVLLMMLQTLLQDEIAEDYAELGMKVSEIPLTLHSVSELVRLCLRKSDVLEDSDGSSPGDNAEDSKDSAGFEDNEVEDEFLEKLETSEFFELTVEEKLHIMAALCHRILMTYSVQDHVETRQQQSAELWKERLAILKEENDKKRAEKLKRMEAKGKDNVKETNGAFPKAEKEPEETSLKTEVGQKETKEKDVKIVLDKMEIDDKGVKIEKEAEREEKIEGKNKEAEEKGVKKKEVEEKGVKIDIKKKEAEVVKNDVKMDQLLILDTEDMISAVKNRRLLAAQAKKEKEEQDRQLKEKLEKEAEEERVRKHRAAAEKAFHEGIAKAKLVLRRSPIGTDRNHNRYWLFSDEVPGLYIEKGWIHDGINYTCALPPKELKEEDQNSDDKMEAEALADEMETEVLADSTDSTSGCMSIETTVPKQGQNLWFLCDTPKELDELFGSLHPQGVRESELKERLHKRYQDILHSIYLSRKPNPGLKTCDGQQELLSFLRTDVIEVATRLHRGGLGYLDETTEFEARVRSLDSLKDFGDCIISLQASVIKKFLQGFMAPKPKKKKPQTDDNAAKTEEVDDEKRLIEEAKVASAVEKWKTAIRDAQTFSRMHVLLGMLDACIKWDMSSENARCKVCRKKGEDDKLILCDKCNKAFHLFCLRPALYEIPDGEWQCPACQPSTARRNSRGRNYAEESDEGDDDDEDEEEESTEDGSDEEDEEDDYGEVMGQRLRSRRTTKAKQKAATRPTRRGRPPVKKSSTAAGKGSRQRAAPANEADVDELVHPSKKGTRRQNHELQKCEDVLNKLIKYRFSWPFREPVTLEEAEDYMEIVSNPMDFQTMLSKCTCNKYHTVQEFLADIKLVFNNAELYNPDGAHVLSCLEKTEDCLMTMLQKHLPSHTYQRRKPRRQPAKRHTDTTDEEEEQDSDQETVKHSRGRKNKK
ncbi:tyrosine-protein kinase BAZ1B [Ambystoma mexicanum]|uniref:tyrosine-protein kinase BAZ1B n=1 Tax=Ambystoma mexicanum TaxID=8296 RepID=UPI0037E9A49A